MNSNSQKEIIPAQQTSFALEETRKGSVLRLHTSSGNAYTFVVVSPEKALVAGYDERGSVERWTLLKLSGSTRDRRRPTIVLHEEIAVGHHLVCEITASKNCLATSLIERVYEVGGEEALHLAEEAFKETDLEVHAYMIEENPQNRSLLKGLFRIFRMGDD